MRNKSKLLLLFGFCILLFQSCAETNSGLVEGTYVPGVVIISFKMSPSEENKQKMLSIGEAKALRYRPLVFVIKIENGMTVQQAIDFLKNEPNVDYVEPNHIVKLDRL